MKLKIRDIRKARGYTMKELADKVGVTESAVSLYELGKREPSYKLLEKIADALEVTVQDLMQFEPPFFGGGPGGVPEKQKSPSPGRDELTESIMELFDSLPESDRQKALGYLQALADSHK